MLSLIPKVVNELEDGIIDQLLQQDRFVAGRASASLKVPSPDQSQATAQAQREQCTVRVGLKVPLNNPLVRLSYLIEEVEQFGNVNTRNLDSHFFERTC